MDRTTNWAIIIIAGILTWAFSSKTRPHFVLLLGFFFVFLLAIIESRRYRVYIVWKSRIRVLEENFIAPLLHQGEDINHKDWKKILAEDLKRPTQKIDFSEALSRRLRRIYNWLFLILLGSWIIKISMYPSTAQSLRDVVERASIGPVDGLWVFLIMGAFITSLLIISLYRWEKYGIFERKAKGEIRTEEKKKRDWKEI
ncbi:MAG: DUF2270 domain-containing protein [Euryarchaeota archaeon]|nr:DUF2270 domain-containing protein [Euryarchaeota archaeon]